MSLLDDIYRAKTIKISDLYQKFPFSSSIDGQYPGNVIQYLFIQLSEIDTQKDRDGYRKEEWLKYKKVLLHKICGLISAETIETFNAKECATSMHRVAVMLSTDLKSEAGSVEVQFNNLFTQLHNQCDQAKPQSIANGLWAIAKLVEAGKITTVETVQVNNLFTQLHNQCDQATPQNITNGLWAIAKLIEAGKITTVETVQVNNLFTQLHNQCDQATPQNIVNGLWAGGIISTITSTITVPQDLIENALNLAEKMSRTQKNQVIMGMGLLNLEEKYSLSTLINACRPESKLEDALIKPYIQDLKTYEKEAFVCGFFVDLLITLPNKEYHIIEFDGETHLEPKQRAFDIFRDSVLTSKGYKISRVTLDSFQKWPFMALQLPSSESLRSPEKCQRDDTLENYLSMALQKFSHAPALQLLKANFLNQKGDFNKALEVLFTVTTRFPYFDKACLALVKQYLLMRNQDNAVRYYEHCKMQFQGHNKLFEQIDNLLRFKTLVPFLVIESAWDNNPRKTQLDNTFTPEFLEELNKIPGEYYLVGSAVHALLQKRTLSEKQDVDIVTMTHPTSLSGYIQSRWNSQLYTKRVNSTHIDYFVLPSLENQSHMTLIGSNYLSRDFTIGCLYCDKDGYILDPTGLGIDDWKNKVLRMVKHPESALHADPVLVLRAIKYMLAGYTPTQELHSALINYTHSKDDDMQHIHAVIRKLMLTQDQQELIKKMNEYALLEKMFNIKTVDLNNSLQQLLNRVGLELINYPIAENGQNSANSDQGEPFLDSKNKLEPQPSLAYCIAEEQEVKKTFTQKRLKLDVDIVETYEKWLFVTVDALILSAIPKQQLIDDCKESIRRIEASFEENKSIVTITYLIYGLLMIQDRPSDSVWPLVVGVEGNRAYYLTLLQKLIPKLQHHAELKYFQQLAIDAIFIDHLMHYTEMNFIKTGYDYWKDAIKEHDPITADFFYELAFSLTNYPNAPTTQEAYQAWVVDTYVPNHSSYTGANFKTLYDSIPSNEKEHFLKSYEQWIEKKIAWGATARVQIAKSRLTQKKLLPLTLNGTHPANDRVKEFQRQEQQAVKLNWHSLFAQNSLSSAIRFKNNAEITRQGASPCAGSP